MSKQFGHIVSVEALHLRLNLFDNVVFVCGLFSCRQRVLHSLLYIPSLPFSESSQRLLSGNIMTFMHLPSLTISANSSQYSDRNNVRSNCQCSCTASRWQHTTQRGRVTPARWLSSSQTQTDPAVPAGLSSKEESCLTASRWPGVSIS